MVTKDLGPVSAYALAVAHGFDGTEEEWAILQAKSGENALAAAKSAEEAKEAAGEAATETADAIMRAVADDVQAAAASAEEAKAAANTAATEAADGVRQAVADDATLAETAATRAQEVLDSIPADYTTLADTVAQHDAMIERIWSPNVFNPVNEGKYLLNTGGLGSNANYVTSDYIAVSEGDQLQYQFDYGSKRYSLYIRPDLASIARVCGYDADKAFVAGSYGENVDEYAVPAGVAFIRVSLATNNASIKNQAIIVSDDPTLLSYEPYGVISETIKPEHIPMADTVAALDGHGVINASSTGASVSVEVPQLKKNVTISYYGKFDAFADLYIYQGKGTGWTECYCKVTDTLLEIYRNGLTTPALSVEHGLTIADYISVTITLTKNTAAKVYIASNGGTFTSASTVWTSSRSTITAEHGEVSWTNMLSWGSADFLERVWMYGDSYFDHWLPKVIERGFTAFLDDGYSGGTSANAYASFQRAITMGCPSRVVWCLGMNDADSDAINAKWLESITGVKAICDAKGIDLVVATIPNVPARSHTYKNDYIRANFDYIDIAEFVGSNESTAWHAGLLSSDEVHPSAAGDYLIANLMQMYLPEIRRV